jgi:hypothetical protein
MADEKEYLTLITPRGVTIYPHFNKPDKGTAKFPKDPPEYNVKLRFSPGGTFMVGKTSTSHDDVVEKLTKMRDAHFETVKARLKAEKKGDLLKKLNKVDVFKSVVDDEGNDTGELTITAKTYAEKKDKETGKIEKKPPPKLVDAKNKEIKKLPPIGGGSEMKLKLSATAYHMPATGAVGITYYLDGGQLLKLVKFGGDAESMGFGVEDDADGYSGEEDGDADFDDESSDDSDSESGDDAQSGDDF